MNSFSLKSQNSPIFNWKALNPTGSSGPRSCFPSPRSGAASAVVDDTLYLFGGYGGSCRLNDFYAYNFQQRSWTEIKAKDGVGERPGVRENNGVMVTDDEGTTLLVFGGYNGRMWLNDLWSYDITSNSWKCLQRCVEEGVRELFEGGGESSNDEGDGDGDINGGGGAENAMPPTPAPSRGSEPLVPSARFGYCAAMYQKNFVLFGGYDGSKWLNDTWEFDLNSLNWTLVRAKGKGPSARSCPSYCKDRNSLYVLGGYDGVERKNDFFVCDLSTYTWTEMPNFGAVPSPRYFHSCCLHDKKM